VQRVGLASPLRRLATGRPAWSRKDADDRAQNRRAAIALRLLRGADPGHYFVRAADQGSAQLGLVSLQADDTLAPGQFLVRKHYIDRVILVPRSILG
jgi:hypothetical protein